MKNQVYEQIQARKVRARLRMLQHAQRVSGNVSQTCRFFGVSWALFYIWKERFEKQAVAGLGDMPRRPHLFRFRIPTEIVSLNGKVERSRENDSEEFYQGRHFEHKRDLLESSRDGEPNTTWVDLTLPSRERLLRNDSSS